MTIFLAIAAAIIGALFWVDRSRYYRHTYGPLIVSNEQDISVDGVDAYCDDTCDDAETFCDDYQDDDSRGWADDYRDSAPAAAGRDN